MSQRAEVYNNGVLAGLLEKTVEGEFVFTYVDVYLNNIETSPISLTLPKTDQVYLSSKLFPFFSAFYLKV